MEFRVLGPLEVLDDDGVVVPLGGPRPRALLALLLLHANEVVSTDRLIDGIWGASPPASAANALQVHVHTLRVALGGDRIVTRAPGYVLRVEPGELDADRFRELVDDDEPHAALSLWRGPGVRRPCRRGVRSRRRRAARGEQACRPRSPHRGATSTRDGMRPSPPSSRRSSPRTLTVSAPRAPDARAVPLGPPGRGAGRLPRRPQRARRARARALVRASCPPAADPSARPVAGCAPARPSRRVRTAPGARLIGRAIEVAAISALLGRGDTRLVTLTGPVARARRASRSPSPRRSSAMTPWSSSSAPSRSRTSSPRPSRRRSASTRSPDARSRARSSSVSPSSTGCSCSTTSSTCSRRRAARRRARPRAPAATGARRRAGRRSGSRPSTSTASRPCGSPARRHVGRALRERGRRARVRGARAGRAAELRAARRQRRGRRQHLPGARRPSARDRARRRTDPGSRAGRDGAADRPSGSRSSHAARPTCRNGSARSARRSTGASACSTSRPSSVRLRSASSPRLASLESIEHVVDDAVPDVAAALEALLDSSLVLSDADAAGEPRFRMLETIREYAVEELRNRDVEASTRRLHLDALLSIVTRWDASRRDDPNDRGDMASSTRSTPTGRGAQTTRRRRAASKQSSSFSEIVWRYWRWRGYVEDAHHHLDAASSVERPPDPTRSTPRTRCSALR